MIRRENGSSLGNSISYNPINDDKTLKNYLALAYVIEGIKVGHVRKRVSISRACRAFGLYEERENKKQEELKIKKAINRPKVRLKAINVFTKEEKEFIGIKVAHEYTGVSKSLISYYINRATKNAHTKDGWKFERLR